jgi:hypothetical protein
VDHLVVKLSSKLSQKIDSFRTTFPTAKWIQLFRQPEHVLASLCSKWIEKEAEFLAGDTDSKMLPWYGLHPHAQNNMNTQNALESIPILLQCSSW